MQKKDQVTMSSDASGFVSLAETLPEAALEIRYYSGNNFIGEHIDGYEEPIALLTKEAAYALKEVSNELLTRGYRLKIFDAYRPARAVAHFVNWAMDPDDTKMKEAYYPGLDKSDLIPQGYIAKHSSHSQGSTVDLTLVDEKTGEEIDMGGSFDFFGEESHPDYPGVTKEQFGNRMLLRETMIRHGFRPL
ncbi:MAG: M15 family metallopeptidase, partial [Solobacterium sp.]|nr:M15 family metallopeptidase [Solobacterium sp.]